LSLRLLLVLVCSSCLPAFGQAAEPIPGAPFSADLVTIHEQTQVDGDNTQTRDSGRIYRDSSGRLRQELAPGFAARPGPERLVIVINDPVASILYVLEVARKIAHRTVIPKQPDGRTHPFGYGIPFPANDGTYPTGKPDFKSESLGTQTMQGIEVQGLRMTTTWSAESQGYDKDLVSLEEMWTSRALGMALMIRRTNFRWGTDTQQLENIRREEPDASLFVVPPDYRIVDMDSGIPPK
jgi:hypothetical protein